MMENLFQEVKIEGQAEVKGKFFPKAYSPTG